MNRLVVLRPLLLAVATAALGACATSAPVAETALPGHRLGPSLRRMRVPLVTVSAQKEASGAWQNVLFKTRDADYCVALRATDLRPTRREPSLLSDGHGFKNAIDRRLLRAHIEGVSVHREGKLEHYGNGTTRYCQPEWGYPYGQ